MRWICFEYLCVSGHRTSSLEERNAVRSAIPCPVDGCDLEASKALSAPRLKFARGVVSRGRNYEDDRPPNIPDTRELAEGMPYDEWRKKTEDKHRPASDADFNRQVQRELDRSDRVK